MNNEEVTKIKEELQGLIDEVDRTGDVSDEFIELLDEISDELETAKENKKIQNQEELKDKLESLKEIAYKTGAISEESAAGIIEAIQALKIEAPEVEVAAPVVNVQPPEVKVTVPEIKIPEIKPPIVNVTTPDLIAIKKPTWLASIIDIKPIVERLDQVIAAFFGFTFPRDPSNAISVRLSDGEKFYKALGGAIGSMTGNAVFRKADNSTSTAVVDDNGNLQISQQPYTTIYQGNKTVPTGSAQAVGLSQSIHSITIKAIAANTYPVFVGSHTVTTSNGFELYGGESVSLDIDNISSVYVISTNAAQEVRYIAI